MCSSGIFQSIFGGSNSDADAAPVSSAPSYEEEKAGVKVSDETQAARKLAMRKAAEAKKNDPNAVVLSPSSTKLGG